MFKKLCDLIAVSGVSPVISIDYRMEKIVPVFPDYIAVRCNSIDDLCDCATVKAVRAVFTEVIPFIGISIDFRFAVSSKDYRVTVRNLHAVIASIDET